MPFYSCRIGLLLVGNLIVELLLILMIIRDCHSQFRTGIECDENQFYAPYVKIRRKRSGGDLASLDRTGFMDVSFYIDAVLCINGPVVMLREFEERLSADETMHVPTFYHGKIEVLSHKCLRINKLSSSTIQRLRDQNLPIRVTKSVQVIGLKVTGVQLVGISGDYLKPTAAWFLQEKYGHQIRPDRKVTDGSFAVISNTVAHCLKVSYDLRVSIISKAMTDKEVCFWSIERSDDHFDRYEKVFREDRNIATYKWIVCSPRTVPTPPPPDPNAPPAPPPVPIEHDPFAIIDPRPPSNPIDLPPENFTTDPNESYEFPSELELEFRVEAKECYPLNMINKTGCPVTPPPAANDDQVELFYQTLLIPPDHPKLFPDNLQWKSDILDMIADLFNRICEPTPFHFPFTVFRLLEFYLIKAHEDGEHLSTKRHFNWDLITSDLNICRKHAETYIWFAWNITSTGGSSLNRKRKRRSTSPHSGEFAYDEYFDSPDNSLREHRYHKRRHHHHHQDHVEKTHKRSYDHNFLSELESDFLHSMESLPESQRYKKETVVRTIPLELTPNVMFQDYFHLKRRHEKDFQYYPIGVRHVSKQLEESDIFYYEDTAEFEYDLNVGIDLAWKIWATVAGYCNQFYPTRQSETFPRFQNSFHEDFLEPLDKLWKHPQDNEVVRAILSKFNDETVMAWLDTCLEGAFVDSKTRSYRPPRPLTIVGGANADLMIANTLMELPSQNGLAHLDIDSIQKLHQDRVSNIPDFYLDKPSKQKKNNKNPEEKKQKKRKYKTGIKTIKREKTPGWIPL